MDISTIIVIIYVVCTTIYYLFKTIQYVKKHRSEHSFLWLFFVTILLLAFIVCVVRLLKLVIELRIGLAA